MVVAPGGVVGLVGGMDGVGDEEGEIVGGEESWSGRGAGV